MSEIDNKINYLKETKELIKNALIVNGADIKDEDTFRSYADKINNIDGFKPLDICNITIDNSDVNDKSRMCFYKPSKEYNYINTDSSYNLICHSYPHKLGIRCTQFDNDNIHVNAEFIAMSSYSGESILLLKSDNNWRLNTRLVQINVSFIRDKNDIFYNDTELTDIHPFLANNGFSKIKKEIKIPFDINKLKISDVYNTEISIDKDIIIFLFNDGEKYMYVFPSIEHIIFINTDSGYNFNQNSYLYPLTRFPSGGWFEKSTIAYDETTGAHGLDIDQHVLVSTKNIYDENDNLLFEKNANIEDFI